ncbi:MAG: hypothetical protein AAGI01_19130 [Myxococcota bacterium]
MSTESGSLFLFRTSDRTPFAQVQADRLDVYFPDEVQGWSDVLDCRVEPYTEHSIEENCHFAEHVHKKFILVSQAQIDDDEPLPSTT